MALVFELCRGKEIRERKTRLSRFEFAFVRETEIVLFVLCMCAIRIVVLHDAVHVCVCMHDTVHVCVCVCVCV